MAPPATATTAKKPEPTNGKGPDKKDDKKADKKGDKKADKKGDRSALPPPPPGGPLEEPITVRYSRHHELPLSCVSSAGVHALAIGLLLVGGALAAALGWGAEKDTGLDVITLLNPPGGGGDPNGVDGGGVAAGAPKPVEDVEQPKEQPKVPQPVVPTAPNLADTKVEAVDIKTPPEGERPVVASSAKAIQAAGDLSNSLNNLLVGGGTRSQGRGGSGEGGGLGSGKGKGTGYGEGEGKQGKLTIREARVLRWEMNFNTTSGTDYLSQLTGLEAMIGLPNGDHFLICEDLQKKPYRWDKQDPNKYGLIFWVDRKPDSVVRLATALGLKNQPEFILCFFPRALEDKLVRLEKQASGGAKEESIALTQFEIQKVNGKYEPVVMKVLKK